ncbi:MAG: carboxypeptidase regulatory-like domain-containing protein [Pyrinomonadaceae bacterium]
MAQTSTTGVIEGTLTDVNGAAVPGVTVTANSGNNRASATTNDEGFFRIPNLLPGRYTVTVEAGKGFAKFERANVEVNLSRPTNVKVELRPAAATDTVTVTASSGTANEVPGQTTAGSSAAKVTSSGGLTTITFEPKAGTVRVILPDDIRAGDTISGTVVSEPKGHTPEERAKKGGELKGLALEINGKIVEPFTAPPERERESVIQQTFWIYHSHENRIKPNPTASPVTSPMATSESGGNPGFSIRLVTGDSAREELGRITIPYTPVFPTTPSGAVITPDPKITPRPGTTESGAVITPDPKITIPPLGQQGRPIEIFGPFDGNASNTTLRFGPPGSKVPDFEKGPENVSGGFGLIRPLAESPRKVVFEAPSDITGPKEMMVKDGDGAPTTGTYRNVGVQLSAPKTNLMRGERTTLTVEVRGLEGIKEDVPLQLDSKGVITMDGGNFQNLRIKPQEVNEGGRYTTTRAITGQQAGGFTVTATVIVRRFDFCLQDDTDPNRLFYFNSFTGDYLFACGGGSCRPGGSTGGTQTGGTTGKPGGMTQPGGTGPPPIVPPTGVNLTGIGRPTMKGCIITLSHNAPDRRVFARLDACTKSADANVQTNSPKADINITDKNVTDNTAASPPK